MWILILAAVLAICPTTAAPAARHCDALGLCSVGKIKGPFLGDIHPDAGLHKALDARSHSKELILLLGSAGSMLLPLLQSLQDLELLGYAHVLPMAKDEATCNAVAGHIPSVGCAYSSFQLGLPQDVLTEMGQTATKVDLFHNKWRTAARILEAGYNLLLLDTDVLLLDDPYKYFKAEPFSKYNLLAQAHLTASEEEYRGAHLLDPGIVYVQNARPWGATSWLVAEMSDRALRWAEDGFATLSAQGIKRSCSLKPFDMLNDVVASAVAGSVVMARPLLECRTDAGAALKQGVKEDAEKVVDWGTLGKTESVPLPPGMQGPAGVAGTFVRWMEIKVPGVAGAAGEGALGEASKALLPSKRGALSRVFREQLASACSGGQHAGAGCRLWPDVGDAEAGKKEAAGGEATDKELLLLLPPWLAGSYHMRGRQGYWSVLPGEQGPRQVLGHAQSSASFPSTLLTKAHLRMAAGAYHWDLVHKLKGKAAYFASRPEVPDDVPGVVTVHPDLLFHNPDLSKQQFVALLESSVQVAQYTHKSVGWPVVPCSLPWVLGTNSTQRPWPAQAVTAEWLPHVDAEGKLVCTWLRQLSSACVTAGAGVLPLELEHMKERYRLYRPMDPSPEKTLMAQGRANPDFTKRLKWQPVQEVAFRDLAAQVVNNLVMLPGSVFVSPTTYFRMHAVYLGQAIKVNYVSDDDKHLMQLHFPGESHLYLKHLPNQPATEHATMYETFRAKCLGERSEALAPG